MTDKIHNDPKLRHYAELITKVMYEYSENAQKEVNKKFKVQLAHNVFILTHIYKILDIIVNTEQEKVSDELFESQAIIWQACNTMIGAIQLSKQGYVLEPQYLMRSAFESLALAFAFHADETIFEKYKKNKVSGNDCIRYLKTVIKDAGTMYGILSKVTHPSRQVIGTHYNMHEGTLIVGGGYTEKLSYRTLANLSLANFMLLMMWETSELIFYDFNTTQHFWLKGQNEFRRNVKEDLKQILKQVETDFSNALSKIDNNQVEEPPERFFQDGQ